MDALIAHLPTVILFVLVLAVLVLTHELGHFIAARLFGIEVEEFGFGFPPRVFGVKKGKTLYTLNWIPLGGFVRIKGEDDPSKIGPDSFGARPAYQRVIVIVAGVFMNLVTSSLLFAFAFGLGVPQIAEDLPADARPRDLRVQVIEVLKDFPAEEAGLRPGDVIVAIDGQKLEKVDAIQELVNARAGGQVTVSIARGKDALDFALSPAKDPESGRAIMGVALAETATVSYPPHVALWKGVYATGFYLKEIVLSIYDLIRGLFDGKEAGVEFSGPVGIAVLTGRAAKLGLTYLLQFAALLSVNLAVINVLPIPALDGGRLLFILIERVRGKSVRPMVEAVIHRIAFLLLLGLVVLVTIKDLGRYSRQILDVLKSVFGVA